MKNRKLWQKAAALALAAVMACATSVFAATYESGYIDVEAGSKTYLVQSILYEDNDGVYRASTWAQTEDSSKVPANYIGVKAELMSDDAGDVIAETAWKYNSTTAYFMSAVTKKQVTPDRVYSRGQVKLYTGTKHITEYAPETTYVGGSRAVPAALLSTLNADGTYPETASGETYGSTALAPIVGREPDLISVRGVGGVRGYVRNGELNPDIDSPAEYREYLAALEAKNWRLPVYDLEGNVIGEFELSKSEDAAPGAESPEAVKAALEAESRGKGGSASRARLIAEGLADGEYLRNAAGETYGSTALAPIVGHEPDLISVRGVGGVRGYVRNEELNPDIDSPEAYQEYLAALEAKNWRLPVYDLEGNVIGEFELSKSEDAVPGAESPEAVKAALEADMA